MWKGERAGSVSTRSQGKFSQWHTGKGPCPIHSSSPSPKRRPLLTSKKAYGHYFIIRHYRFMRSQIKILLTEVSHLSSLLILLVPDSSLGLNPPSGCSYRCPPEGSPCVERRRHWPSPVPDSSFLFLFSTFIICL